MFFALLSKVCRTDCSWESMLPAHVRALYRPLFVGDMLVLCVHASALPSWPVLGSRGEGHTPEVKNANRDPAVQVFSVRI